MLSYHSCVDLAQLCELVLRLSEQLPETEVVRLSVENGEELENTSADQDCINEQRQYEKSAICPIV